MDKYKALCARLCGAIASQDNKKLLPVINDEYDKAVTALAVADEEPTREQLVCLVEDLALALDSAGDFLRDWGSYVEDHWKQKHCFQADLEYLTSHAARARRILDGSERMGECD